MRRGRQTGAALGASLAAAGLLFAAGAAAQGPGGTSAVQPLPDFPLAEPRAPVLTLDQERLFEASRYGQRVLAELAAASEALARENRRIEAELLAEEQELRDRRAAMEPEAFRELAEAFDAKATGYRQQQDAKARALQRRDEAERQAFFRAAGPILADLVAELGAVAILDDRAILFAAPSIDVTDRAIARIDAEIGAGEELSPPPQSPSLGAQDGLPEEEGGDAGDDPARALGPPGAGATEPPVAAPQPGTDASDGARAPERGSGD